MAVIDVPAQRPTIAAALAMAAPGDTIRLGAGYSGEGLVLVGVDNLYFQGDASNTGFTLSLTAGATRVWVIGDSPFTIAGNDLANIVVGGSGSEVIYGYGGDDYIVGGQQASTIDGGAGADQLYGGAGADYIVGGDGADVLVGLGGVDSLYGGAGDDYIVAGNALNTVVDGGAGANSLWGAGGNDYMVGGEGADLIVGAGSTDMIFGGAGADTIYGGEGGDFIYGDAGNDFIWTDDVGKFQSRDYVYVGGGTGVDTIADFKPGNAIEHDVLVVSPASGFSTFEQIQGAMTQVGVYTVIAMAGGDQVYLYNVQPFQLTAVDFLFI